MIRIILAVVLVMALAGCHTTGGTLRAVAEVQAEALGQYVEVANGAISTDAGLTPAQREYWQEVGRRLVRNQDDIYKLTGGGK